MSVRAPSGGSDFDHLEVVFGDAAIGARPGVRYVRPARAGFNALFRDPDGLVVDKTADDTHPGAEFGAGAVIHGFKSVLNFAIVPRACCNA